MENFFIDNLNDDKLVRALTEMKITDPTPIQAQVIPVAMSGVDVVAKAPTGTGKTLGFVLPILKNIEKSNNKIQAIILCPTRELVMQITSVIEHVLKFSEGIRCAGIYGGQNIQRQLMYLRKKPQIIVGTVGRVLDHMSRKTIKLENTKMCVLDEGDEMLDMGFRNDIEDILAKCPPRSQKLLFSATIPKEIKKLVEEKFNNPIYIETKFEGEETPNIKQYYGIVKDAQRVGVMLKLIEENDYKRVIAFTNTKRRAEKLGEALENKKANARVLHGDLKQNERTYIMNQFKRGNLNILVATDVAARGIDVDDIDAIFNIDPPTTPDFYVHRIGRTARANKVGTAYTFISNDQTASIPIYQKVTKDALEYMDMPTVADSYTLPRDCSNKLNRESVKANTSRFFVNVGKKDMLDKDTVLKLVTTKTNIKIYEVTDIKLRDTYGFIEVVKGQEKELQKIAGMQIGNRVVNIEKAQESDKEPKDSNNKFKSKKNKEYNKKDKDLSKEKKSYNKDKKAYNNKDKHSEYQRDNRFEKDKHREYAKSRSTKGRDKSYDAPRRNKKK